MDGPLYFTHNERGPFALQHHNRVYVQKSLNGGDTVEDLHLFKKKKKNSLNASAPCRPTWTNESRYTKNKKGEKMLHRINSDFKNRNFGAAFFKNVAF